MTSIIKPTIILHATQKKKYGKFSMTYHQLCVAVSEITWGEKNVLSVCFLKLDDQIHKSKHQFCFTHFCEHSSWHAVEVQEEVLDGYTNNAKMAHTTCLHNSAGRANHTALPKGKGTGSSGFQEPERRAEADIDRPCDVRHDHLLNISIAMAHRHLTRNKSSPIHPTWA